MLKRNKELKRKKERGRRKERRKKKEGIFDFVKGDKKIILFYKLDVLVF